MTKIISTIGTESKMKDLCKEIVPKMFSPLIPVKVKMLNDAKLKPRKYDPESPIKILDGQKLYLRKAAQQPTKERDK